MREFARYLSNETGCSIIVAQGLDDLPVTVDVVDEPLDSLLANVAKRLGMEVNRNGNLFYIGELKREDRGILVRQVRRLQQEEISKAIQTILSDNGQAETFTDGLMVVSDRVEVLARVNRLCEEIESADASAWIVQLYLLTLSEKDHHDVGIDGTPAIDIGVAFAGASTTGLGGVSNLTPNSHLHAGLNALLHAAKTHENVGLVAEPLFYLSDGQEAHMARGERVPVPNITQNTTQATNTTQTSYTYQQTGLTLKVKLREMSKASAWLNVNTELSEIVGYVDNKAPRLNTETFETQGPVVSGGVYLIGSNPRTGATSKQAMGLRFGAQDDTERRVFQVWARAVRVGRPLLTGAECYGPVEELSTTGAISG